MSESYIGWPKAALWASGYVYTKLGVSFLSQIWILNAQLVNTNCIVQSKGITPPFSSAKGSPQVLCITFRKIPESLNIMQSNIWFFDLRLVSEKDSIIGQHFIHRIG